MPLLTTYCAEKFLRQPKVTKIPSSVGAFDKKRTLELNNATIGNFYISVS